MTSDIPYSAISLYEESTMVSNNARKPASEISSDKERFWRKHAKRLQESGLSRMAYCRKHQLSHDQFSYWLRKWRKQEAPLELLPVQLKEPPIEQESSELKTLCTLAFKNGHQLKIYNQEVLPMLLSLWG